MSPRVRDSFFRFIGVTLWINSLLLVSCGETHVEKKGRVEASQVLVKDVPASLSFADSAFRRAEFFTSTNQPDSALQWHQRALTVRLQFPADEALVRSYLAVGSSYVDDLKYHVGEKYLERARVVGDSIGIDADVLIEILFELSDCKRNLKDFPLATSLLERAMDIIQDHRPRRSDLFAKCHLLLSGTFYMAKDYQQAIEQALKAIARTPASDHQNLSTYFTMLGMAYHNAGEADMALKSLDKAISHDMQWAGPGSDAIAIRYVQKAATLRALNRYGEAYGYLRKNLAIRQKIYGTKHVNTFGAKYSIGQYFLDTQQFDSALFYYHASLAALLKDFSDPHIYTNPKPSLYEMNTDLVLALVGKASALHRGYMKDTTHVELLLHAWGTYVLADSVFGVYRRNFVADGTQLQQVGSGYIPYPAMMDVALAMFRQTGDPKHVENALRTAEKSRAVVLQDAQIRAESYGKAGIDDDVRVWENFLMGKRQSLLQQLSRNHSEPVMDSLRQELVIVNDSHQVLLQQLAKVSPEYFSFRYDDQPLGIEALQTYLREKDAVLFEYLWSDDKIYVITVSGEARRIRIIPVDTAFSQAFRRVTAEMRAPFNTIYDRSRFESFCRHSQLLYRQLIEPDTDLLQAGRDDRHILISADGPLESFPFEVLIREAPSAGEVNYHLPYLFMDFPISYTFSSRMLLKPRPHERGKNILGFAYTTGAPKSNMDDLPGTEKELIAIREIIGDDENIFLMGSDASESNFKHGVGKFGIVHLALHGLGDTVNALESHLVFRSENDSLNDGKLYAHELYNINLGNLQLAVLSACESGIGKRQSGEGVMSIARSFAYGGCRSQVISLWKIDDGASSAVMSGFYQHLADGNPIDQSLAMAKADYLSAANEFGAHPAFWAAFIPVGDNTAVFEDQGRWKIFVMLLAVALVAIILIFRWTRGLARQAG